MENLGLFSGALTTFAFIPQIVSIWSKMPKPAEDVSFSMYIIFIIGIIGWLIYGIKIKKAPIIIWNAITFVLAVSIIGYKIIYG
ncbi:SemiSWEET transporter [Candidatus Wolfebacteria bacterium]|nr:SemiSWEET transporter [Candidatus Wolfebacteria bacterium]